jgi:segregation and condensation protein A
MTERLLTTLTGGNRSFLAFRASCVSREEVLVGFLAMLVLVRRRVVDASQDTVFGDITLQYVASGRENAPLQPDEIDELVSP